MSTLSSQGFKIKNVHVDPHRSLAALMGAFPGVEFDVSGAEDHLDKIDSKIKRIKEMTGTIIMGSPCYISKVKDLATYVVS
jgi:hypothetical protein